MQKKLLSIIFGLFFLCAFDYFWVGANPVRAEAYRYRINFGKARPIENMVVERNLSIKTSPGEDWVKVSFDSALDNRDGDHISTNRLTLSINDRNFKLDRGPFEVDLKALSFDDKLFLNFSLKLTPGDSPGNYQGIVTIETPIKKIAFQLEVEVQPWVRLETDRTLIRLDQVNKEDFKVSSSVPLTIRLASNAKWVLSVNLGENSKIPFQLRLEQQRGIAEVQYLFEPGGRLGKERRVLAVGNSTVRRRESYWAEVDLVVYIDDFYKYPAGERLLQLRFLLELWDKKTVTI